MVVNKDKTEVMWIGKSSPPIETRQINNANCTFSKIIKAQKGTCVGMYKPKLQLIQEKEWSRV